MCRTNLIEFNLEDNISTKYSTDADSLPVRMGRKMGVLLVGGVDKCYWKA